MPLRPGGRVLIETDEGGSHVAWPTTNGGRAEAHLPTLGDDEVKRILAVFGEAGPSLTQRHPDLVRERLLVAIDPDAALYRLLGCRA
jgi:hypothetical protein